MAARRRGSAGVFFLGLLLAGPAAAAPPTEVKDQAKFFSPAALRDANAALAELYRKAGVDVVVETFDPPPKELADRLKDTTTAEERSAVYQRWGEKRIGELGPAALHVLLTKNPRHLRITYGKQLGKRGFGEADLRRLSDVMIGKLIKRAPDDALAGMVAVLREKYLTPGEKGEKGEKAAPAGKAEPKTAGDLSRQLAGVKVERYAAAPTYSEGPTWRKGELFFCSSGLLKVAADRTVTKVLDLAPAGTYLRGDGSLLICDNKTPALLEWTPDGTVNVLADAWQGKKLNSLNDLTVDRAGNVYWTDPAGSSRENPVGKVFRLTPRGDLAVLAADLAFPNGLEVDPASKHLYVIESQTAKVLRYDLPGDGEKLGRPVVFAALGGAGGDGCAFDAAGNLWVADFHRPDTKHGRVTVLDPDGAALAHLDVPAKQVSNVTFGGPGHDALFITTGEPAGAFHARVGVPGFRGHPGTAMKALRALDVKTLAEPVAAP